MKLINASKLHRKLGGVGHPSIRGQDSVAKPVSKTMESLPLRPVLRPACSREGLFEVQSGHGLVGAG
jgi:hypothetical protein